MSLPKFPLFCDSLDPAKDGLYSSFSGVTKVTTLAAVRDKSLYLSIVSMSANTGGTTPWTADDLSTATVSVSIDNADLFPSQGNFYLSDGTTATPALASTIGSSNIATALNALPIVSGAGGLTAEEIGQDFICTWNNNGARALLTSSIGSLYPASSITITELQAGSSTQPEIQSIRIQQLPATFQSTFTPTTHTGYVSMDGVLSLATPGMLARFDSLPSGISSFAATLQVDVQFPGEDPQTILSIPVTVLRDVTRDGVTALPPFATVYTKAQANLAFIQNWIGTITALSSGAGTLSGIATASGATALGTSALFIITGISNGWYLASGTAASGPGIQRPDDFNASTNAVLWKQFI